jgi:hypothetical protein
LQDSLGSVFAIGIHYQNRVAWDTFLDVDQTDCNGSLMAEIAAQAENGYAANRSHWGLKISHMEWLHRPVVHHQDVEQTRLAGEGLIDSADELTG